MSEIKHTKAHWLLALAVMCTAGVVHAQGSITVSLSGSDSGDFSGTGVAHFAGEDALMRAMAAINNDNTMGPGTVVTIEESGLYVGAVLAGQEDITIQAADGVVPEIIAAEGGGTPNRLSMVVGAWINGEGNFAERPGSLTLLGSSEEDKMIVYVGPSSPGGERRALTASGTNRNLGLDVENVHFAAYPTGGDQMLVAVYSGPATFTNCLFDGRRIEEGGPLANGVFTRGNSTVVFNDCEWISQGNWWLGQESSNPVTVNGGSGRGQALRATSAGVLTFNDFSFADHRILADANWYTANTNIVFDNITLSGAIDVGFMITQGMNVTVKNSILTESSATVLHARVLHGNLTFENCDLTGRHIDFAGTINNFATLNLDRVLVADGCYIGDGTAAASTGVKTLNAVNSVFLAHTDHGGGVVINMNSMGEGNGQSLMNLTHCVVTGSAGDVMIGNGNPGGVFTANYSILDASQSTNGLAWANAPIQGSHNIFWGGSEGASGVIHVPAPHIPADSIIADPLIDADGRLVSEDSPASAAAWDSTLLWDFEGEPRPQPAGTEPDIGAYEADYMPTMQASIEGPSFAVLNSEVNLIAQVRNAAGNITYTWSKDGEVIDGEEFNVLPLFIESEDAAGVYSVTINADNGPRTVTFSLNVVTSLPVSSPLALIVLSALVAIAAMTLLSRRSVSIK